MTNDGGPHPGLSRLLHLAAGFAAGCGVVLVVLLVTLAGVPLGTAAWVGVFLVVWAAVFALFQLKLPWTVAGLALGVAAGYLVLSRVFGF
jgi:hypothetical protein